MTDLLVRHPPGFASERAYIFDVILGEFLGVSYKTVEEARNDVAISVLADPDRLILNVADVLFQTDQDDWLKPASLPSLPLTEWEVPVELRQLTGVSESRVPVLYGRITDDSSYYVRGDGGANLGLDVFGAAFFMLSRYEELCTSERDDHDRYPASSSVAIKAAFLERPIINEYVELLWAGLRQIVPTMERRPRSYRAMVSHDVDRIFMTRKAEWRTVIRNSIGDLTRRRDPVLATRRIRSKIYSNVGDYRYEPANTFEFIMDHSEKNGIRSSFYWIAQDGTQEFDADYELDMPWIQSVIKNIGDRGHELGLHGSYDSYKQPGNIKAELDRLVAVADSVGVQQDSWGGRQHYLRWDAGSTWQHWDDAGLHYDSTLGYAEAAGFRCGICYDYPVFNVLERKKLELRERPLIAMEVSLQSEVYMGLSAEESIERIKSLADQCRRYDGEFTLLWHNDNLVHRRDKKVYRDALAAVC